MRPEGLEPPNRLIRSSSVTCPWLFLDVRSTLIRQGNRQVLGRPGSPCFVDLTHILTHILIIAVKMIYSPRRSPCWELCVERLTRFGTEYLQFFSQEYDLPVREEFHVASRCASEEG